MGAQDSGTEPRNERLIERFVLHFREQGYQLRLDSDGSWSLDFIPGDRDPLTRETSWAELSRLLTALSKRGYLLTTQ